MVISPNIRESLVLNSQDNHGNNPINMQRIYLVSKALKTCVALAALAGCSTLQPKMLVHIVYPATWKPVGQSSLLEGKGVSSAYYTPGKHLLTFERAGKLVPITLVVHGNGGEAYVTVDNQNYLRPIIAEEVK